MKTVTSKMATVMVNKEPATKDPRKPWGKLVALGLLVLVLVAVGVAAGPRVVEWLQKNKEADKEEKEKEPASPVQFLKDAQGRPGLEVMGDALEGLNLRTAPVQRPGQRILPAFIGQTAYDSERWYPVRSIANGRVISIEKVPDLSQAGGKTGERPIGFGDSVHPNQLLAIVRSPDLADKKGAYVDALLTLFADADKLNDLEGPYRRGAIPEATYRDARTAVEKDINGAARARRTLELVPLKPQEITDLEKEAQDIRKRIKELSRNAAAIKEVHADAGYRDRVERWARIEVTAPAGGVIVEKNTNVGDIADPGKDPPLFRIVDLDALGVWIHVSEEYVPLLQKVLNNQTLDKPVMEIRLESQPQAPALKGRLVKFASSVDPNQHTALLIGRVENPEHRLLVGQLITVSIRVPPEADLVEIPIDALNEVGGQSLVLVQDRGPSGNQPRPRFFLRRVQVVSRLAQTAQVRSQPVLNAAAQKKMAEEVKQGLLPIEGLHVGDWVVTSGVVELTDALQDLQAEARNSK